MKIGKLEQMQSPTLAIEESETFLSFGSNFVSTFYKLQRSTILSQAHFRPLISKKNMSFSFPFIKNVQTFLY